MTEERLVSLLFKRLSGTLVSEEARELEEWAGESPENQQFLQRNESLLEKKITRWKKFDPAQGYAKWTRYRQSQQRARILRIGALSAAASLLLAVVVISVMGKTGRDGHTAPGGTIAATGVPAGRNTATLTLAGGRQILLDSAGNGEVAMQGRTRLVKDDSGSISYVLAGKGAPPMTMTYNVLTTPRAGQYQLRLPDGSHVWLNNVSSIRYPTAFSGKDRTVELTGEAYFDIAADRNKPFIVKVRDEAVEVLGTSFDVLSYPEEGGTQTTVLTGAVKVRTGTHAVSLRPDEQSRVGQGGDLKVLTAISSEEVVSWKNGFFYFGHTSSFDAVMRQLARWYDVDVVYKGKVPDMDFTGKIDRSLPLEDMLKYLDENGVHFRVEGRKLIVLP